MHVQEKDSDSEITAGPVVSSLSRQARILRKLTFIVPVTILSLIVLIAIFADLAWLGLPDVRLAPYDPVKMSLPDRLMPPFWAEEGSTAHILGTDKMGRDILSRLIFGARISLSVSLLVILITSSIGTILGIIGGYLGGRTEAFLMRITDISMAFPPILVAMLLVVSMNPSFLTYQIATAMDIPDCTAILVEDVDPEIPLGAKTAEGTGVTALPAIANAIYDAIGVRIKDLPITPEKILNALKEKRGK